MTLSTIHNLDGILATMYFVLFVFYGALFLSNHLHLKRFFNFALPIVLIIHLTKLITQGIIIGYCPIVTFYEAFSFTAFTLGVMYLIIERRHKYFATGAVFIGISFLFQLTAFLSDKTPSGNSIPIGFHAPLALIGMALLTASAIYGAIYLIAFYLLKSKRFGSHMMKIPSLEAIERMQNLSCVIGVALSCIAMISGFTLILMFDQEFVIYDPKILITLAVVGIYGYAAYGATQRAFSAKRKAIVTLIGFGFALISMTVLRMYVPTFHNF